VRAWISLAALALAGCYQSDGRGEGPEGGVPDDAGPQDAGPDAMGTESASAAEHCADFAYWSCTRDRYAGRIDDAQLMECLRPIATGCDGVTWAPGCAPTTAETAACIALLRDPDLASMTTPELLASFDDCELCP
jgi:hypothetical protein